MCSMTMIYDINNTGMECMNLV